MSPHGAEDDFALQHGRGDSASNAALSSSKEEATVSGEFLQQLVKAAIGNAERSVEAVVSQTTIA